MCMVFRRLPRSFVVPAWEDMDTPVHDLARDVSFKTLTNKELDTLKKQDPKAYRKYIKRYHTEYDKALQRDVEEENDKNGITRRMNLLRDALRSQKNQGERDLGEEHDKNGVKKSMNTLRDALKSQQKNGSKHVPSSQGVQACLSCGKLCMP